MLQFIGSQRVGHDLATEQQQQRKEILGAKCRPMLLSYLGILHYRALQTFTDPSASDFHTLRLTRWLSDKESTCQCRRHKSSGLDSWVGKIPWRRKWQPTAALLPGKSHGWIGYSSGRLQPDRLQSMGSQRVGHDSLCKSEGGGGRVFTAEIPGWFGDGKKLVDSCLTF